MNGSGARQLTLCGTLIFQVVFPSLVLIRLKVLCTPGEELQAWASARAIVCSSNAAKVSLPGCLDCSNCAWVKHHANVLALTVFKVTHWLKCVYEAASLPLFDF